MTKEQIEKYTILQQVLLFLAAYDTYFSNGKQLPKVVAKLKNTVIGIDEITEKKIPKASKPTTKDKSAAKTNMIAALLKASKLILEWAKELNDTQLIQDFTITKTSFKGKGLKALNLGEYIYKVMVKNQQEIVANTDVTDAQIAAVGDAVAAFKKLLIKPTHIIQSQSTITALYKPAFALSDAALVSLTNLVEGNFDDDLQLMTDFNKALVYHAETEHTQLLVRFKNKATGALIEGAKVYIKELDKKGISTISGLAKIVEFEAGTYHVLFSAENFVEQTQIITFKLGEKMEMVVEMEEG